MRSKTKEEIDRGVMMKALMKNMKKAFTTTDLESFKMTMNKVNKVSRKINREFKKHQNNLL